MNVFLGDFLGVFYFLYRPITWAFTLGILVATVPLSLKASAPEADLYRIQVEIQKTRQKLRSLKRQISAQGKVTKDLNQETSHSLKRNQSQVLREKKERIRLINDVSNGETFLKSSLENQFFQLEVPFFDSGLSQDLWVRNLKNYQAEFDNGFVYRNYQSPQINLHLRIAKLSNPQGVNVRLRCEGPFRLKSIFGYKAGRQKSSNFYEAKGKIFSDQDLANFKIKVTGQTGVCQLRFQIEGRDYKISLRPGLQIFKNIGIYPHRIQLCGDLNSEYLEPLGKYFFRSQGNHLSCPRPISDLKFLEKSIEGHQARVKILLGVRLSAEELQSYRPDSPLNFSRAPDLDAIFISTLNIQNDVSGSLILRLLEFHAKQGAEIRFITSKVGLGGKNRRALNIFADKFKNVQVQLFRGNDSSMPEGFHEDLSPFHTIDHIKIFLAHSQSTPSANQVILGGRNIGDAYAFQRHEDLGDFSDLIQYPKDKNWVVFQDFEYQIRNGSGYDDIMAQFLKFWGRQQKPFLTALSSLNTGSTGKSLRGKVNLNGTYLRSQMSYPRHDDRSLEQQFVNYFDRAISKIDIATPYFNPTPSIAKAMERAMARGVKIRIVTNTSFPGDDFQKVISIANIATVNSFFKEAEIYGYASGDNILHSKIYLIDGKVGILGSTNLNQRSFFYDVENVSYIYSKDEVQRLESLVGVYQSDSLRIRSEEKTEFLFRTFFRTFQSEF